MFFNKGEQPCSSFAGEKKPNTNQTKKSTYFYIFRRFLHEERTTGQIYTTVFTGGKHD